MSKSNEKYSIEIEPIYQRASSIIENARTTAYKRINEALVRRNWEIGQLIVEEERKGNKRADYGVALIKVLSKRLTKAYGKGFTKTNLYSFARFYEFFPEIFHSVSGKSGQLLTWTHYRIVVQ
ncbi:MAG: DUF1016 N-terminal domain-containing protein [Candidatus Limisoma sp.]